MSKTKGLTLPQAALKRGFDFLGAAFGLALTIWIILPAWVLASIDTRKNGFFTQDRVGRDGRIFRVIKFRTMREVPGMSTTVTTGTDQRITSLGRFWRKSKIDELPQLINVLKGDMSFVGPRPDVPGYADRLQGDDRIVLSVRPGITGPATLKYRDEEAILADQDDPERYNNEVLWPDKVRINREYVENWSFWQDINYLWKTVFG
ncbi:MAG: sugar transferase [Desulfobacteraceae bacterium]|nr:sugar transferase [Desulfobacteraceae bacterium]